MGRRARGLSILAAGFALALVGPAVFAQDADRVIQLAEQGANLLRAERIKEALPYYEEALRLVQKVEGFERVDILYYNAGLAYAGNGHRDKALSLYKGVYQYREREMGADHPETLGVLSTLVTFLSLESNREIGPLSQKLVEGNGSRYGTDSVEYAGALESRVHALGIVGDPKEERLGLVRKTVAILEARKGANDPSLARPMITLAGMLATRGEYDQADLAFRRVGGILRSGTLGPKQAMAQRSALLAGTAVYYQQIGRFLDAEAASLELLANSEQLAREIPFVARNYPTLHTMVGETYLLMGLPDKAALYFEKSLALHKVTEHAGNPAMALGGLARARQWTGRLDEAETLYRQALEVGQGSYNMSLVQINFGTLYRQRKKYDKAAELILEASEGMESEYGAGSPYAIRSRLALSEVYLEQGKLPDADKLYTQLVKMLGETFGNSHPDLAEAQMGLARVCSGTKRVDQAIALADQARRTLRRYVRTVLPALAEHEQLQFIEAQDGPSLEHALALAMAHRDQTGVIERSLGWILNSKGVAQEAIAQRTLLARNTTDPRLASVLREWLTVRYRLAKLTLADPTSIQSAEQRQREIELLTARDRDLAARLGRAAGDAADPWIEVAAVRKALPDDAVLVEMARVAGPDGGKTGGAYLAWIVPPAGRGEVKLVELGSVAEIEAAVTAARKPLVEAASQILDLGEREAETELQKPLAELAKKLLVPLAKDLAPYRQWILCPTGGAWLVPWAALPLGPDKYVVEKHTLSYVVSGRDLAESGQLSASGNPALVLADPDFDLAGTAGQAAGGNTRGSRGEDPRAVKTRGAALRGAVSKNWQRLPGTAKEAAALKPKLTEYLGAELEMRTGAEAAEQIIREAWQPRVAVLSTHGFFLEPAEGTTLPPALRNPLVRCGLALAGANRRSSGEAGQPDDGILTGLEILGADLRGTELVVLSACETGLGEVRGGEGVAGLRQAFQLAGAQSVLATLWRIPDADTARLMGRFYEELAQGGDKAEALRKAQLMLLEEHRKSEAKSGHPFFWAAFGLTGSWRKPQVKPPVPRPKVEPVRPRVEVIAAGAQVMDGPNVLARVPPGHVLEVTGEQGEWLLVKVAGTQRPGWILKRSVREMESW